MSIEGDAHKGLCYGGWIAPILGAYAPTSHPRDRFDNIPDLAYHTPRTERMLIVLSSYSDA